MIFSLTAFAETEAGAFLPGCRECAAMLQKNVKLSTANKCKTKYCKGSNGSAPKAAPAVDVSK